MQGLPDVTDELIHSHELFARYGLIAMLVTGTIALGGALFYSRRPMLPGALLTVIMLVLLTNCGLFVYIGYLGGLIMYVEIR